MLALVLFTGLVGFLVSVLLLHLRVDAMWLRYGISVVVAYGVFFGLLCSWIMRCRRDPDFDIDDLDFDLPAGDAPDSGLDVHSPGHSGWDLPFDLDFDEAAVLLAFAAAIGSAIGASAYVVICAPSLFAELLLDGVLNAALYRQFQKPWLGSAFVRTRVPVLCVIVFFVVAGAVSQRYAPEAHSIGGVLRHYRDIHPTR